MMKDFNKQLMLDNITYLLKETGKKIGELETESGVSTGYISRISKEGNTKPGIDFIMNVAESLNVSINTLLNVDLTAMTPNERYILSFLKKLNKDTIDDKLDWIRESADQLNRAEVDRNGDTGHPLLSLETFYEEGETEYPEEVTRVVFVSNSFDCKTSIHGDCFNLRLKNGSILYFMDISKSVYRTNDTNAFAKEVWMYTPSNGAHFLCSNNVISPLADLVDELYATVSEIMKHPRIKQELQYVIDAFMKDDLSDDDDEIPF